ncbi:MAG: SEC-C motif domain protein [Candidatus Magnetoglobus multicellularis str. Araruama]|uniref:SEC-C motif domain protein n=1 Tax=Candidatus Magnetoglobus multicellularis str. Araruama TaxID=890399 RepID=A0A1V1P4B9_9BACT|nr:MAG: SEC-C motif domain protein [Candidatus Magnetoglobus multicellularis str. Araruama]
MKQHIIESTPIQQVDASFPEKKIERDSLMIGFHQIFPYAENLIIHANDILYYLDDQYCLASTCSCTHTILTFLAIKDGQPMSKSRPMVMMFDYKDKSYKVVDPGATVYTPPEELFNKILNSNLVTKFKERHKKLRLLYYNFRKKKRKSLKKSFKNPFMAKKKDDVQKVGRNDPCPCGSGKKFKKCCM